MKKTKVAFFAEILIADFDGASRTMFQILDRIPKEEFEFLFVCGVPPDKELGFEVLQVPTFRVPFNNTYRVALPFLSKRKLQKTLDEFQPDVIHFASPSPLGAFAKNYAIKNQIPLIAIYHTHFITYIKYYFRKLPFLTSFFYKKSVNITRDYYKHPEMVYVPSSQIIHELQDICKLPGQNLKLWQRGIDRQLFNPAKRDKTFIRSIVKNDLPNILFVSRLVWEKNLQTLIDLYHYYEKQKVEVNFIVAGDGVAREEVKQLMPNAFFTGALDHEKLSVLYASADVFIFPSDTETFGNVVIEAMASGLPCVVADGGGPKGFIKDEINGFLVPTNDVKAYFDKIQLLLENPILKTSIVQEALLLSQSLSWDNLVDIYFSDLKKMARRA